MIEIAEHERLSLDNSAIILAGGSSRRFGQEKGLVSLFHKPLVLHVLDRVPPRFGERIVVVSSEIQKKKIELLLKSRARVVRDQYNIKGPLAGALTGFKSVHGEYSLLLPCDTPFVSSQVVEVLHDLCINSSASIPKWPNGYIEPLQAVYCTNAAKSAAQIALKNNRTNVRSMIDRLESVKYISTDMLRSIDAGLLTFLNINCVSDLKEANLRARALYTQNNLPQASRYK